MKRGKPGKDPDSYIQCNSGDICLWVPGDLEFRDNLVHVILDKGRGRKILLVETALLSSQ